MTNIFEQINRFVWGVPALVLILGIGIYLSVATGWAQFSLLPRSLKQFVSKLKRREKPESGENSSFRALCTALAATVGTGNLAGVAGAIALGGPGAVFWMWICGIFGMVTKYAEAALAVRYRVKNACGEVVGGPMHMIYKGMGSRWQWLAGCYSFFGVVAAFGVGNAAQINAVIGGINSAVSALGGEVSPKVNFAIGLCLAILLAAILSGGAKRIGRAAELLVPFAAGAYLLLACGVLICRADKIPDAFSAILNGAFSPNAVTGGAIGSFFVALRVGASRGVFTNEAGMGTASIAHAAADVRHPAEQGMMGIIEVFLDTIVICTVTALAILCSGVPIPYGTDPGAALTSQAFCAVYGQWAGIPIAAALCCFAVATVIGWGLYGVRCAQFLFGEKVWKFFSAMQVVVVVISTFLGTGTVWAISETVNGLMAIPNLIALACLSPELLRITKNYQRSLAAETAIGGTYEDFYQCKPL